jgi:MoxR-like ATPase
MAKKSDYIKAIAQNDENPTADEIADEVDEHLGHTQRKLKELAEEGEIERERGGNGYEYFLPAEAEALVGEGGSNGLDRMPVNRGYDFSNHRVEEPHEYFSSDDELAELNAMVNAREATGEPVRALIDGDTGTGKTTLAENVSALQEAAYFEVQMSPNMDEGDLFGSPALAGDESVWVDGTVTKALMASAAPETQVKNGWAADLESAHDGTVVLLIDEVNRAPPRAKNALFSALDHRGHVTLEGPRAGEVISGDPLDLVVIGTINQGDEYHGTARMDLAEKSRWTTRFTSEYLAQDPDGEGVEREAELLVSRKGVAPELARTMVETVARVRKRANDRSDRAVTFGIPTRAVLAWGGTAHALAEAGLDNPVVRAAERAVVKPFYDKAEHQDARDEVMSIIEDKLHGAPFEADAYEEFAADEIVECGECDYRTSKRRAEDEGVMAVMECPECGGTVERKSR